MASRATREDDKRRSARRGRAERKDQAISGRTILWAILLLVACSLPAAWLILARPMNASGGTGRPALPDITVEPVADPANREGQALLVTSIRSAGAAARQGLQVGDLLESVDGQPVASVDELTRALHDDSNMVLTLHLRRGDHPLDVRLDRRGRGGANGA